MTNLSQYFPELRHPLSVGYSLSKGRWARLRRHETSGVRWLQLGRGSRCFRELHDLLDVAVDVVSDNEGVSMAPSLVFDALLERGTLTVVTDTSRASVDDGFGVYTFVPGMGNVVFMMSSAWPPVAKAAIDAAATNRAVRAAMGSMRVGLLSMPAREVFASLALASAVQRHVGRSFQAVVAIGDCDPAAKALSRRFSRSPQIQRLVAESARSAARWLGVCVPREWNVDADQLSHPSRFGVVSRSVVDTGLWVCKVDPPSDLLLLLETVVQLPLGRDDAPLLEAEVG